MTEKKNLNDALNYHSELLLSLNDLTFLMQRAIAKKNYEIAIEYAELLEREAISLKTILKGIHNG